MIFGNGIRNRKHSFWTAEEIDLHQDLNRLELLSLQ